MEPTILMKRRGTERLVWMVVAMIIVAGMGCRDNVERGSVGRTGESGTENLPPSARVFPTRGVIRSIPDGGKTVVVRHEEIPGYMQAMTMELTLRNPAELSGFAVGDTLEFELVALEDRHWIQGLRRGRSVGETSPSGLVPLVVSRSLQLVERGHEFPDVRLRGEDGVEFGLTDLRGKAVAFTFFFTRCPLPDFCPRMLKNFSRARNEVIQHGAGSSNWMFLSISFDPESDTPEVLRRHARGYRGGESPNWRFCSADTNAMSVLIPTTQLMVARDGESFSHNLRTVVLDTRGRVHRRFDGNEWTASELAASVVEASKVGL